MTYSVKLNGFHGTDEIAAKNIIDSRMFKKNYNDQHWLGQGIYFFEEDPDAAMIWALFQTRQEENAVVVKAEIEVKSSSYLNLNTRKGISEFDEMKNEIEKVLEEHGISIQTLDESDDEKRRLRCFVLDSLPDYIKVIKKSFPIKTQPQVLKGSIMESIDIEMYSEQICIRDYKVIKKESIEKYSKQKQLKRNRRKRKVNYKGMGD